MQLFRRSQPSVDASDAVDVPADAAAGNTESTDINERRRFQRAIPVAQVIEGNAESDWALWEEALSALNSQMLEVEIRCQINESVETENFTSIWGRISRH